MATITAREWRRGNVSGWAAGATAVPGAPSTLHTVFVPHAPSKVDRSGHNEALTRSSPRNTSHRTAPTFAQWRAYQLANPGMQPPQTGFARQPFKRPVIHRPAPAHLAAPMHRQAPTHRQPPNISSTARWAHPRQGLDCDDMGRPLDTRKLRKMLLEAGIEVTERDIALMLHEGRVRKDYCGPSLDVARLFAELVRMQCCAAGRTECQAARDRIPVRSAFRGAVSCPRGLRQHRRG